MYFSLPSDVFKGLLANAKLASNPKSTLPILGAIRCEVSPDGSSLSVMATDLDLSLVQTIPLEFPAAPGVCCIYLAGLATIRPDKSTPVRIDAVPWTESNTVDVEVQYVTGGLAAKAGVQSHNPEEFPMPPAPAPEDYTCTLPGKTLAAIGTALHFSSEDETRFVLRGVYLTPDDGGSVVATDGRRMIVMRTKATPAPCIFPTRLCTAISRLKLTSASCAVTTETQEHHGPRGTLISIRSGNLILHATLPDGNYPNYKQVIPRETTSAITFTDPAAVASWLSSLPLGKSNHLVTLEPKAPHHVDLVHASGRITTLAYLQNNPPAIGLNPEFLADCLTCIGGTLSLIDSISPGVFRNTTGLAVLMPMRVPAPPDKKVVSPQTIPSA